MAITPEVARVFRGGGRRYFTAKAAARAEAKSAYEKAFPSDKDVDDWDWRGPRVERLARMILRNFKNVSR